MQNPPEGWRPKGWQPSTLQVTQRATEDYTLGAALRTWQWWALVAAALPEHFGRHLVDLAGGAHVSGNCQVSAITAAAMVGVVSIGNALGRVFWAWVSDLITRALTFLVMFLSAGCALLGAYPA